MMDFRSFIIRAKEQGQIFLVGEKNGKDIKIFFSDDQSKLPDFVGGILFSVAKTISSSSNGKYTATKALEALMNHSLLIARTLTEKYDNLEAGIEPVLPNDMGNGRSNLN